MSNTEMTQNTSGMGEKSIVPPTVMNQFNWGAFLCTWIWGIANKTYITLIILIAGFIPFMSLILSIWFGFKGNEWAWRNKRFESEAAFHEYQIFWVKISLIFIGVMIFVSLIIAAMVFAIVMHND